MMSSQSVKVWRVEDAQGGGPYNGANPYCWTGDVGKHHHPSPGSFDEFGTELGDYFSAAASKEEFYFGFDSSKQVEEWFAGAGQQLQNHGLNVSVYEVPEYLVLQGKYQVAFHRERSKRIAVFPATSIIS